jgi:hypothetical protein
MILRLQLLILDCRMPIYGTQTGLASLVGREWLATFPPRREGLQPFAPYKLMLSQASKSKIKNQKSKIVHLHGGEL